MSSTSSASFLNRHGRLLLAGAVLALVGLVLVARATGALDLNAAGRAATEILAQFEDSPWGPFALIGVFIVGAFLAVPQFVLIGVSIVAFGAIWGAGWAWLATLISGAGTYWAGRWSGGNLMSRLSGERVQRFTGFVSRNALVASAVVRNVPTGPFLVVNMVFGAVRAPFLAYWLGMALGVIPKILVVAFGLRAIQAAIAGQIELAIVTAIGALAVFLAGWFYVRHKRRAGEIVSLNPEEKVDTTSNEAQ